MTFIRLPDGLHTGLVETGCDTSELFKIAEEVLDEMPSAIHGEITRDEVFAIRFRRYDGLGLHFAKQFPQMIVAEPFVGQQRLYVDAFDQVGCCDAVVALSERKGCPISRKSGAEYPASA